MSLQFTLGAITAIVVPACDLLFMSQYNEHTLLTNVTEALRVTFKSDCWWRWGQTLQQAEQWGCLMAIILDDGNSSSKDGKPGGSEWFSF